jgi:hypothetical protein
MASSMYKVRWVVDCCRWWLNDGRRRFEKEENSGKSLDAFQPFIFLQLINPGINIITSPMAFPWHVLNLIIFVIF